MIPKIIHYCWFGGNPLPPLAIKCIESWKKFLPDYEIKEWNESNFNVNMIPYTAEAYHLKKYAFVSDYARFYVLYKYGGLYFDTDVEVIKNMDDIIARGPFMGMEAGDSNTSSKSENLTGDANSNEVDRGITCMIAPGLGLGVNPGLGLGVNPGLGLYREVLDIYHKKHFTTWTGVMEDTVVTIMTKLLSKYDKVLLENGIFKSGDLYLYDPEYFCPKNYFTGELMLTERTVCIHHYAASWVRSKNSIAKRILKRLSFIWTRLHCTFLKLYKA